MHKQHRLQLPLLALTSIAMVAVGDPKIPRNPYHATVLETYSPPAPFFSSSGSPILAADCFDLLAPKQDLNEASKLKGFAVSSLSECSGYCKYSPVCKALAYSLPEASCSLLESEDRDISHQGTVIFVTKSCLLMKNAAERLYLEQIEEASRSKFGVEIVSGGSQKCLRFKKKVTGNESTHAIFWGNCPSYSRWKLETTHFYEVFTISLQNKPSWCVESNVDSGELFLNQCRDLTVQTFTLANANGHYRQFQMIPNIPIDENFTSVSGWTFELAPSLQVIYLLRGHEKPRSVESMSVPNATVLNPDRLPFLLPGAIVTVSCHKGFQVSGRGSSAQEVVSKTHTIPLPCLPVSKMDTNTSFPSRNSDATFGTVETLLIMSLLYALGA